MCVLAFRVVEPVKYKRCDKTILKEAGMVLSRCGQIIRILSGNPPLDSERYTLLFKQ